MQSSQQRFLVRVGRLYLKKITITRFTAVPRAEATRFIHHAVAAFNAQTHGGCVELENTLWA